jgi:hypothetical protein
MAVRTEPAIIAGKPQERAGTLPRRDLFVLPLLSLLTVAIMLGGMEILARVIWPERAVDACNMPDPILGHRFRANCDSQTKIPEGPWVKNHYNECGYRSVASCGPKPPGVVRIATLGSSLSVGTTTPFDETFTSRAAAELSRLSGHAVEVQNLGAPDYDLLDDYYRLADALSLKPDVLILVLSPFDLTKTFDPQRLADRDHPAPLAKALPSPFRLELMARFHVLLNSSRLMFVAQHFLFQDPQRYIKFYLMYGDRADFLRYPFSAAWEKRFADTDFLLGQIAENARANRVPIVLVAGVHRSQTAAVAAPVAGVDPLAFDSRLGSITEKYGIPYVNGMEELGRASHPDHLLYVVDGHPTVEGEAIFGEALVRRLCDAHYASLSCNFRGDSRMAEK